MDAEGAHICGFEETEEMSILYVQTPVVGNISICA